LAERTASFSADYDECQKFQREVNRLVDSPDNLDHWSKEERKGYFKAIKDIIKHLQKRHKLIDERNTKAMWTGIGIALGPAMSVGLGNIALGIPIGLSIGVAIGASAVSKASKDGKLI